MQLCVSRIHSADIREHIALPLFLTRISAGFPSPAEDYLDRKLDLNEHLVKHPAATFFVKVDGESMIKAGINHGDILIVDRSLEPADKKIVIAGIRGELTVKRIRRLQGRLYLMPENENFAPLEVSEDCELEIWGVVTSVIHPV